MSRKYDVIIIGAGIGGLVCGCYLASYGFKVFIAEQHSIPGGYCTSFTRKNFIFDVGIHYLGSMREESILYRVLKELDILDRIPMLVNDPTDRIITPDKTLFIRKDKTGTKNELIEHFPREKENINAFFNNLIDMDFLNSISKMKNMTFKDLLDDFFNDYKLKAVLSIPLGNMGLSASRASALVSVILYREFIFDGGYYPKGGIQVLPNTLAERFNELGGTLLLSTKVQSIITKHEAAIGVRLETGEEIFARSVVSNADAHHTFEQLLDFKSTEYTKLGTMEASPSAFMVYAGLNKPLDHVPKHFTTWFFSTYDIEKCYNNDLDLIGSQNIQYLVCTFASRVDPSLCPQGKSTVRIYLGARFSTKDIWDKNRQRITDAIIKKMELLVPEITDSIEVMADATPCTFLRYTNNYHGAIVGWSAIPTQITRNVFPPETSVKNLYLTGHWVTNGLGQSGIPVVALSGQNVAKIIKRHHATS